MSCARATTRNIRRWFALSSVIVSLGCVTETELAPPNPANHLPKDVEAKGADFRRQIAPYTPTNPHDRDRKAKCDFCSKIKVRIEALGITTDINPLNPPATGRPVAHLVNMDNNKKIEKYYGLLPHEQAEYYLWVDAKSSTQAQWTLLELSHKTDSVYAALPANLNYCHKYPEGTYPSEADFANDRAREKKEGDCNVPITEATAKVSEASVMFNSGFVAVFRRVLALLTVAPSGGGWISCSNGCCT